MRNYIGYLLPFFMVLNIKASGNHGSEGWLGLNVFMGIILFVKFLFILDYISCEII